MTTTHITVLNITEEELQELLCKALEQLLRKYAFVHQNPVDNRTYWLSRTEAAGYLKVSLPTLDKMLKNGGLTAHRLGRQIRFNKIELDAAISNRKINRG